MDHIAGMRTTGRKLRGPASDLVELDGANGLRHTAIVFHPRYIEHNAINDALTVVRHYLGSPMVTGMVELADVDPETAAYVYPTGQCWSVAEVIRVLADMGEAAGVRAGLELMFACGQILVEAADTGEAEGVYSHGGLTPWRVMLRKDGQVLVVGYALPQVEILEFHADPEQVPREDSFRYCPPERMEAAAEDISSDLFGLTLIAFELITGKPVYDGLVDDIRQQASRGEGSRRLFRFREALTPTVRELLGRALKPAFEHRYPSGDDFLDAVRAALRGPDVTGPSLMDLMARVSTHTQRSGAKPESASTMMGTAEDFRKLLDSEEDEAVDEGPERAAWAPPPRRPGRRAAPRTTGPAAALAAEEPVDVSAPVSEAGTPAPEAGAPPEAPPETPRRTARSPRRAPRTSGTGDSDLMASLRRSRMGPDAAAGARVSSRVSAVGRTSRTGTAPSVPESLPAPSPPAASDLVRRIRLSGSGGDAAPGGAAAAPGPSRPVPDRPAPRRPGPLPVTTGPAQSADEQDDEVSLSLPVPERAGPSAAPAPAKPAGPAPGAGKRSPTASGPPRAAVRSASAAADTTGASTRRGRTGSSGATPSAPAPSNTPAGAAAPSPQPPVASSLAASAPAAASPSAPARNLPAAASASSPVVGSSPPAVPAVGVPMLPPAAAGVGGVTGFAAAATLGRAPDIVVGGTKGARTQRLSLERGPGAAPIRLKVAGAQPLGEVISNLVGTVLPVRTDLTGRMSGWYRLQHGTDRLSARTPASEAPAGGLLVVHVPNGLVHADIEVESAAGPVRFVAPVGTAVPILSLVDHLCAWLDLPAGAWTLQHDGETLPSFLILDDLAPAADALLALRLVRAEA